jgi:hypothetical protein
VFGLEDLEENEKGDRQILVFRLTFMEGNERRGRGLKGSKIVKNILFVLRPKQDERRIVWGSDDGFESFDQLG